jgi:acyl-CoA thioester hydrolase
VGRVEIKLPEKFLFTTLVPVRIGDINRGNHVSHVSLVQIMEEARAQFIASLGYDDQKEIKNRLGFILGDLAIVFKNQAHYGQTLRVEIAVRDIKEKSFDIVHILSDSRSHTEVARGKVGVIMFDYQTQRVTPIPDDLKSKLMI